MGKPVAMNALLSGQRVLVVEDEMLILMIIESMLADLGCESVTAAATVDQALGLIESQDFDAAMLDVNLNGTRSYPVADALAALSVPFMFSTGCSDPDLTKGHGGRPVLTKPFQYEKLAATFSDLLTRN